MAKHAILANFLAVLFFPFLDIELTCYFAREQVLIWNKDLGDASYWFRLWRETMATGCCMTACQAPGTPKPEVSTITESLNTRFPIRGFPRCFEYDKLCISFARIVTFAPCILGTSA